MMNAERLKRGKGIKLLLATLAFSTMLAFDLGSVTAVAQTLSTQRDNWGLTETEWLLKSGPDLRKAAGFPASAPRLLAAAEKGDVKAAALLMGAYAVGDGVAKDEAQSLRWGRVAADAKLPFGYFAMAIKYQPRGATPNVAEYQRYLKLAADSGHVLAQVEYGLSLAGDGGQELGTDWFAGRRLIERAAQTGEPRAIRLTEMWELNDRFVKAGDGMPLWKDGRGLLSGHGEFWATHPCRTSVHGTKGGRWMIDWTQTKAMGGQKGMLELWGVIWVFDVAMSSKVFGFFEYEGASKNLERSRANFAEMKAAADALNLRCSTL